MTLPCFGLLEGPRGNSLSWRDAIVECSLEPYPCLKGNGPLSLVFLKGEDIIDRVMIRIMMISNL